MSEYYFTDKQVKTRKPHFCVWCGENILVGDQAQYRSYIFDRCFRRDWLHPECNQSMNASDIDEDGFIAGEFSRGLTINESRLA